MSRRQLLNILIKKFEIENSIEKRAKLIKKLKEYKKSLIYEVVTGKKKA